MVEPLSELARARVAAAKGMVRRLADNIAPRGDRMDADDLFQIGMNELCELAPSYTHLEQSAFEGCLHARIRGRMLDHCRAESKVLSRAQRMTRVVEEITQQAEIGDLFDAESARVVHRRRTVNAIMAAAVVGMLAQQQDSPEELVAKAEFRARLNERLDPLVAALDPTDWALVKGTLIDDNKLARTAQAHGVPDREARHRFQRTLAQLGEGLRRAGFRGLGA